ncbi:type II secretion system secretin GspD [Xylophilus sp. Leaf220]|uniref:type II secretion system secretin GspD n=1 Tax=Xylophilus sp. Leaf220 TaxID=1735686 RepID=UPI001443C5BD|nr:type II secretion system secretin GspD [Xylophilus sp. Leaf220]
MAQMPDALQQQQQLSADPGAVSTAAGELLSMPGALPPAAPPAAAPAPPTNEPRILRGTDRVIAAPRPVTRAIAGAPSSFKFEDAPIAEVASVILTEIAKAEVVFHGQVTGSVTIATRQAVSPDQAVFLLETALQANGLVMARDARGTYHIGKAEALRGIVSAPRQASNGVLPPGSGSIVVPLQFIGAAEMAAILRPIAGADALIRVDPVRNLLVMAGTRTQAEGWLDIVNTFDIDLLKGMSVGVFPLKYASVAEVEAALQVINGGGRPAAAPAPGRGGTASTAPAASSNASAAAAAADGGTSALFGGVRVMPIERINSILVVSPRASALDEARRWIERLDRPNSNSTEPQLNVYGVQNGNARHLATVLTGIYGGSSNNATGGNGIAPGLGSSSGATGGFGTSNSGFGNTGGFANAGGNSFNTGSNSFGSGSGGFGGGSGFGGSSGFGNTGNAFGGNRSSGNQTGVSATALENGVRVIADEVNNSILVYATASEFAKIEATLKRLDVRSAQVLIEASIIEVTLKDELQYGLEWFFKNSGAYQGQGSLGGVPTLATATPAAVAGGFAYSLGRTAQDVSVVLTALAKKDLVKVISSPSLMVLDNQTASIVVGDQVPIQTGTTVSSTGFATTNIQYKDTGVQLQVMPSVNAGNVVTMLLTQAVTDVGTTTTPTFRQRQITSKVAVRSGDALVLGGLIRDNTTNGRTGIPFLKDLPVVGAAFSATSRVLDRTELVVILTPRVVRSDEDIREVGTEMRDRMKGIFQDDRLSNRGRAPAGALDPKVEQAPGVSLLPAAGTSAPN